MISPSSIGSIFEEHMIVKQLNVFQYMNHDLSSGAGVYGEDENKFIFYNTIVGRKAKARFKISNSNKVITMFGCSITGFYLFLYLFFRWFYLFLQGSKCMDFMEQALCYSGLSIMNTNLLSVITRVIYINIHIYVDRYHYVQSYRPYVIPGTVRPSPVSETSI